jgi:hypothetical protein
VSHGGDAIAARFGRDRTRTCPFGCIVTLAIELAPPLHYGRRVNTTKNKDR